MLAGDVIVQRPVFPPIGIGLCLQFAVRVTRIYDRPDRVGFAYETLAGHAESGLSEFYFAGSGGADLRGAGGQTAARYLTTRP